MRGYLSHCCNTTLCTHLYIAQISESDELNLHMCGFPARKESVFSLLRAIWSVLGEILNVLSSF